MLRITARASSGVWQPCPTTLGFADTSLRMLAASPMDRKNHIAGGFVNIGYDVDDEGAQELLS